MGDPRLARQSLSPVGTNATQITGPLPLSHITLGTPLQPVDFEDGGVKSKSRMASMDRQELGRNAATNPPPRAPRLAGLVACVTPR